MTEKKNQLGKYLLVGSLVLALLGLGYYLLTSQDSASPEDELQEEVTTHSEQEEEKQAPLTSIKETAVLKKPEKLEEKTSEGEKDTKEESIVETALEEFNQSPMGSAIEGQLTGAVQLMYSDLFKELELEPQEQEKLQKYLATNEKLQAHLTMQLISDEISNDELLKKQDELRILQKQELEKILKPSQQEELTNYKQELPTKMLEKQLDMQLGKDFPHKDKVAAAIAKYEYDGSMGEIKRNQHKTLNQFTKENIGQLRETMKSTTQGNPKIIKEEAMNKRNQASEIERVLKASGASAEDIKKAVTPYNDQAVMLESLTKEKEKQTSKAAAKKPVSEDLEDGE